MSNKISGAEYPIAKIFSSDFDYVIPTYQRPYAWTTTQAGELFSDLYDFFATESDDTYFLGSIVLIKEEGKPHAEVIDGQQRLTTLTILLAALTEKASEPIRQNFKRYLCEPGNELEGLLPKPRLRLRERDHEFFTRHIQEVRLAELGQLDSARLKNESQRNIQANAELFRKRLSDAFGDDQNALISFGSFLVQRCFLVAVSTPSQQSAFRVFSVLNSRGLDLLPTDIIKSDVIGKVDPKRQDEYSDRWEELEVETGRDGFAEVFGHIRMIYAKDKARRTLLDEFREKVIPRVKSAEALVDGIIVPYTDAYLIAKQCQYMSTANAQEINALLGWLNRIDNTDWLPPAVRFLAERGSNAEEVLWFFGKLERLAAYMHICGHDVNRRIERYARVLNVLETAHSREQLTPKIGLTSKEKEQMREALDGQIYELTARRRNYLILRLDSFLSDGAANYNSSLLTIEHVLPQTVQPGSKWEKWWPKVQQRDAWTHRIANLVPLNQRRNSIAQNYDFDKKKKAYFGGRSGVSSYVLTTQVLNTPTWKPEVVERRQQDLLALMEEKWSLQ